MKLVPLFEVCCIKAVSCRRDHSIRYCSSRCSKRKPQQAEVIAEIKGKDGKEVTMQVKAEIKTYSKYSSTEVEAEKENTDQSKSDILAGLE